MIQTESFIKVADNTGAKIAKCIKVFKGSRHNCASIGDIIAVSIQEIKHTKKVKKGQIKYAVVIRTRKEFVRINGFSFSFPSNDIILIDSRSNVELIGSRIFGPILFELKNNNLFKSLFLSASII